ncbi:MAG: aminopeptidase P family protein [Alphaproteobacteria bacterium]|nr:aminopeptidase P family protein [Alphaproteobacteria bacterium]
MSEKIEALRELLKENELDGFIIPHNDEYQEEITAPCAERLKWLTGFTGSAGVAVVLRQKAFLLIDGRYTLQARTEVSKDDFTILDIYQNPLSSIIEKEMKITGRLGYDPFLHTVRQVSDLKKACYNVGCYLVAFRSNPIDIIWKDRPKPPSSPIMLLEDKFSGLSRDEKIKKIAKDLQEHKEDALVIESPSSICWLLNIRGNDIPYTPLAHSYAIVHKSSSVDWFIASERISDEVRKELGDKIRILPPAIFAPELARLAKKRANVRVDAKRSSAWLESTLAKSGGKITPGTDPCVLLKSQKNTTEQEGARKAHIRDGVAVCNFLYWLEREGVSKGINEYEAAAKLESFRRKGEFFHDLSFATISAVGANAAIVHYTPEPGKSARLNPKEVYLVDSGANYLDGTTDITRTVAFDKVPYIVRKRFTQVLKGHIALASCIFPKGTYGYQLDVLARQYLWADGVDYAHSTGHGIGSFLGVHENPPSISYAKDSLPLLPGMILSNEPGYYKEGEFGIRCENVMLVTAAPQNDNAEQEMLAFETLTKVPFARDLIEVGMLSDTEKEWLNRYHQDVYATLAPLLEPAVSSWLKEATLEI